MRANVLIEKPDLHGSLRDTVSALLKTAARHRRFLINLFSITANFTLNLFLSVWFTAYLIRRLGIAVYGLIPLASNITVYLNVLTYSLNIVVGRFLTVAIEREERERANTIFNTAFFGSLFIVLLLTVPGFWISRHSNMLFRVPPGYELDTQWLFACTVIAFIITTLGSSFEIASYCRNRFELRHLITAGGNLTRVFLTVLLFSVAAPPRIWHVGFAMAAATVVAFVGAQQVFRYLLPYLKLNFKLFSWTQMKELLSTGVWIFINDIGTILIVGIDLIVMNRLFGPTQGGQYASVMQWSVMLRNFGTLVAGIFGPTILALYAKEAPDVMIEYAKKAIRFLGLATALPVSLICGFSAPLLKVWLGKDFVFLAPLMSLMTFHLCFNLGYLPLHKISLTVNKVKLPGILQIGFGFLNLFLAITLAKKTGWGMYGVAAAGAIVLTLKNVLFTPVYAAWILEKPLHTFFYELVPITAVTGLLSITAWILATVFDLTSWIRLGMAGAAIAYIYGLFLWKKFRGFLMKVRDSYEAR